jgi:hypothetical protein
LISIDVRFFFRLFPIADRSCFIYTYSHILGKKPDLTITQTNIKGSFMKKTLLLLLLLLLCTSVSFSQFGIKAGINMGTLGGDDRTNVAAGFAYSMGAPASVVTGLLGLEPKARVGLFGGISYKVGLIAGLSIEPGVMYVQRGAVYEFNIPNMVDGKVTMKLDYIDIPVLVKFALPLPVVSPYIEGGAAYGIMLSAKAKPEISGQAADEVDMKDGMNKSNISVLVGVGVEIAILDINARYALGISKLDKDGQTKLYNRGIMLGVGLRF